MKRPAHSPTPSPADRAHILVMKQEAKRERLMRLIEQALHDLSVCEEVMRGDVYYPPSVLHHHGTQWECAELDRVNSTRPASRICFCLPASAYEGRKHVCS